jgi:Glycosyl hydrolase family 26
MTISRHDIANIYREVEKAIGMNAGANSGTWQLDGIWETGTPANRVYYVIVNRFGVTPNPFVPVLISLTPNTFPSVTTTVLTASAGATAHAALANAVALVTPPAAGASKMLVGFYNGNGWDGVAAMNTRFKPWLGRTPDIAVDFVSFNDWPSFESDANWMMPAWTGVVPNLCCTVPLTVWGTPTADVAAGLHDSSFQVVAHALVNAGFPNAIVRIGHEANGGWYPWGNMGGGNTTAFNTYIAAWQHVVGVFRAISPTFKFDWTTAAYWQQTGDKSQIYPGDAYVDYIGMDIEPTGWGTVNPSEALCWSMLNANWSLDWLLPFAQTHGKLISFPELGVGDSNSGYGPGDNGALVTTIMNWAKTNNVAYVGLWDFNAGDYNSQFSDYSRPSCAAAFKAAVS